jgi:ABC-type sugar transport system ATPase subunit
VSQPAAAAITARGLTRRFGKFLAVDRVSFEVERGEIFGYLGANGAGKSTTIRMLCGLLEPSAGQATVAGQDVGRAPEAVKASIGYMSQKFSLYLDLPVEENLAFFGGAYGLSGAALRSRVVARRRAWRPGPPPAPCPAASASGWPWPAPSSTGRRSSSWTSPPPAWTRCRAATSGG